MKFCLANLRIILHKVHKEKQIFKCLVVRYDTKLKEPALVKKEKSALSSSFISFQANDRLF
jgi:hypothetical protein